MEGSLGGGSIGSRSDADLVAMAGLAIENLAISSGSNEGAPR